MNKTTLTILAAILVVLLGAGGYALYLSKKTGAPAERGMEKEQKAYVLTEVASHATSSDCWMAVDGKVYDVTPYVASGRHPGGDTILQGCGRDATELFNSITKHTDSARAMLQQFYIGELTATDAGQAQPTVKLGRNEALGEFLIAGNDMTLYLFTKDEPGKSNCYDQCAINWPPLMPGAELKAGDGISGELSVIDRTDGSKQVAYKGVPLYYWINDKQPGDTTGQGVGNVWFVIKP